MSCEHCPHCNGVKRAAKEKAAALRKYADEIWDRGDHAEATRLHAKAHDMEREAT